VLVPPSTDKGLVPNLRFSFADAHMNLQDGGWSREVTQRELPVATEMAGVNMRLKTGGVRELYWHKQAEWSIMLAGNARITAVDNDGKNFIADVAAGDLWYFPAGIPHSIQGLGPVGCEFLLAFPDGSFSESSTERRVDEPLRSEHRSRASQISRTVPFSQIRRRLVEPMAGLDARRVGQSSSRPGPEHD
jgi:oxalate decarboxylase